MAVVEVQAYERHSLYGINCAVAVNTIEEPMAVEVLHPEGEVDS